MNNEFIYNEVTVRFVRENECQRIFWVNSPTFTGYVYTDRTYSEKDVANDFAI